MIQLFRTAALFQGLMRCINRCIPLTLDGVIAPYFRPTCSAVVCAFNMQQPFLPRTVRRCQ